MTTLIIGLIIFFGVHSIPIVNYSWRNSIAARIGEGAWKGIFSIIALLGLVLIAVGYASARPEAAVIYSPPVWMRHVTLLLLLPVFPMLLAAYLPGRIRSTLKHPMLIAVKTWALAHLLSNGTTADLLLFGSFLAWAVVDRISLKRRPAKATPAAAPGKYNDLIAVVGGLALYVIFLFWAHEWLIGVPPVNVA